MVFILDQKLEQDSDFICDLPLSQVRLMNNAAFPWLILIPRKPNMSEIIDLDQADQHQLFDEITHTSAIMRELYQPKKLNVANLGNVVAQLHLHVIARYETDPAWPNPVWSSGVMVEYTLIEKHALINRLGNALRGQDD